jgi:hypothetical protein
MAAIRERRLYPRTKANWMVEIRGVDKDQQVVREVSKMEDFSQTGGCFLSMCDMQVGAKVALKVKPSARMKAPLALEGEVVRIDENADVGKLFKAVSVRWDVAERKNLADSRRR